MSKLSNNNLAIKSINPCFGKNSTRPVLELHGWGELQGELNRMSKRGLWVEMGKQITDEVLDAFAIVAEPGKLVSALVARYGDLIDQWMGTVGLGTPEQEAEMLKELQAAPRPGSRS